MKTMAANDFPPYVPRASGNMSASALVRYVNIPVFISSEFEQSEIFSIPKSIHQSKGWNHEYSNAVTNTIQ